MAEGEFPVFWSFRRCPYAMRARLALKAAGQRVWLREILLRDKPAAFLAVASDGTVPVLVLPDAPPDAAVIAESRDIMLWALGRADPQGWLFGLSSAQIDAHFDQLDGPFKYHLDRYKYASRFDRAEAAEHRRAAAEIAKVWDQRLAAQPALSGNRPGLLDYASLPFVRQFRIADPPWFDAQEWPHLASWLTAFLESAQLAAIMEKYPLWQEGEAGFVF
jgi:glutathione S-transferase